jgi:hypothetical protein
MTTPEHYQQPRLRYRKVGGGYRREDVDVALAEVRLTVRQLGGDLESLRDRNRDLEGELSSARNELDSYRAKERVLSQTVESALRRAAEIENGAAGRAREIVAQAEENATRMRSEASRSRDDARAQLDRLLRLRDHLLHAMRSLAGDLDHALAPIQRGDTTAAVGTAVPAPAEPEQPGTGENDGSRPFEVTVELDAGPFADFVALSAFEQALARQPGVEDVYARRLAGERARIEVTMTEPAPLLAAMRTALPYSIEVRSASRTALILDVAPRPDAAEATGGPPA